MVLGGKKGLEYEIHGCGGMIGTNIRVQMFKVYSGLIRFISFQVL